MSLSTTSTTGVILTTSTPLDKVIELYERLLQAEWENNEL